MSWTTQAALKFRANCYTSMTDDQVESMAEIFERSELDPAQIDAVIMAVSVHDALRGTEAMAKVQARIRSVRTAAKVRVAEAVEQQADPELSEAELIANYERMARDFDKRNPRLAKVCRRRIARIRGGEAGQFSDAERRMFQHTPEGV